MYIQSSSFPLPQPAECMSVTFSATRPTRPDFGHMSSYVRSISSFVLQHIRTTLLSHTRVFFGPALFGQRLFLLVVRFRFFLSSSSYRFFSLLSNSSNVRSSSSVGIFLYASPKDNSKEQLFGPRSTRLPVRPTPSSC